MCVGMLTAIDHVKTINRALSSFVIHLHVDVMTRESGAKIDRGRVVARLRTQLSPGRRDMKCAHALTLDLVVLQPCALSKRQVYDRVSQVHAVILRTRVAFD